MAIDLNKDKNELKYYYSDNGATLGPFTLTQLLQKIEADTLVYREGIDWTNAENIEELNEYFQKETVDIINSVKSSNQEDKSPQKSKYRFVIPLLIILVFAGVVFAAFFNKNNNTANPAFNNKPIEAKIYANAKKRNKLIIGTLSINEANTKFNACLKEVFGDRFIKFSSYTSVSDVLKDMENGDTDILILKKDEINEFREILDLSEALVWEGYVEDIYIAVPKNNEIHLQNIINCYNN
jgi:hypothetical protein